MSRWHNNGKQLLFAHFHIADFVTEALAESVASTLNEKYAAHVRKLDSKQE